MEHMSQGRERCLLLSDGAKRLERLVGGTTKQQGIQKCGDTVDVGQRSRLLVCYFRCEKRLCKGNRLSFIGRSRSEFYLDLDGLVVGLLK